MKFSLKKQLFYLALAAICLVSTSGAVVYYFYTLNWLGILITLCLTGSGLWLFWRTLSVKKSDLLGTNDITKNKLGLKKIIFAFTWLIPYFLFFAFCFMLLFKSQTNAAITSPWQVVPAKFFIAHILATAYLFFLILKKSRFTLYLVIAHYFLSFSILWIIFKIGYGYDPFIHQATLELIDKQGFVLPKTPYYLGQYSLILLANKLFFIPIVWLNKLLVPILVALTLPPTIFLFLKKFQISNFKFQISILLLLILPFSIFTLTVPQNLAYLFLILTIFITLTAENRAEIMLSFLLAAAALSIHPIAGIPALLFSLAIFIYRRLISFSWKKIIYALIIAGNALILPILFYLTEKNNAAGGESSGSGFTIPAIFFPRHENIFLNFVYFFAGNEWLILIFAALLAAYAIYRFRKKYPTLIFTASFAFSLLIAFFITRQIGFNFLIDYERSDYANRLLLDAFIFLLPAIAIIFVKIINLILNSRPFIKYSWLVFLIFLIAVSLYSSYPRQDNYFNSHSFAVGKTDFKAVNWIEKDADSEPYVVLADQQVSVAALSTFGFSHYVPLLSPTPLTLRGTRKEGLGVVYFYPIPTGGPLYQIYLDMVYKKPDRATALRAADLTGAHTVYFVVNKYWTGFDKIVEQAKIEASSWQNINNEIYIFKYQK